MPPRRNKKNSNNLRSITGKDYQPLRRRIFLSRNRSSCAAEQFHSEASVEAPNNSKNWQWTPEGDVSVRRLTFAPHGGERPYSFLQAARCYRCTNVSFVNSSTSTAPWIACKGAFIQDPLHVKLWTTPSAMCS
ncbi:uncharacterized protein TNCV_3199611 [Trichonephila clavipes]|nr:uncharacterized protein TNCV_3199611 [Trichonephila clavipes]